MDIETQVRQVINGEKKHHLILGDCKKVLQDFPDKCIDSVITSPPYWQLRDYNVEESMLDSVIGIEEDPEEYVSNLVEIFDEIKRILKPRGSVWLNLGDKYVNKNLMGMPWRVAFALQKQGWILRNDIIWKKQKGAQPVKDRLRNNYEHIFHLVKNKKYYFDVDAIRIEHRLEPTIEENKTISSTGVSGKKYRKQILESTDLNADTKVEAIKALDNVLQQIRDGEVVDFRMTIRGYQRTLHGNSNRTSGRAKELEQKGFYIMKSDAKGYVPSDIWTIIPEDEVKNRDKNHYAVYPVRLLDIPIKATCPKNGIILDPFVGVGSTILAAQKHERKSIGIDISGEYLESAQERIDSSEPQQMSLL